jgi:hypothetical protein
VSDRTVFTAEREEVIDMLTGAKSRKKVSVLASTDVIGFRISWLINKLEQKDEKSPENIRAGW